MPTIGNTQMAWGIVAFDATTNKPTAAAGTGNFSIYRGGTGLFDIEFDDTVKFSSTPTVAVTQIYNGGTLSDFDPTGSFGGGDSTDNSVVVAVSTEKFRLITGDSHGNKQDRMFNFLVVGPGTQSVTDPNKQVIYGNIVYDSDTGTGNELERASGTGDVTICQWDSSNHSWGYGRHYTSETETPTTNSQQNLGYHPPPGIYGIEPGWNVNDLAIVVQQIYSGKGNSCVINNFESDGGSTLDNAVADSISVEGNVNIFTAGDSDGNRQARNIGYIAIGG